MIGGYIRNVVSANRREFTWKYWVFLGVWEVAIGSIAIASIVGGAETLTGSFVGWACFLLVAPVLPLLIPMRVQHRIGSALRTGFVGLWVMAALWAVSGYVMVWLAPESTWAYEWRYSLDDEFNGVEVTVNPRPHDCEFWTAPLGKKHCHYEKQVWTTRVRRATTGQRLMSLDEGRTWVPHDGRSRPLVFVSWQRVQD
jgi:hypothetical protein